MRREVGGDMLFAFLNASVDSLFRPPAVAAEDQELNEMRLANIVATVSVEDGALLSPKILLSFAFCSDCFSAFATPNSMRSVVGDT